MIVIPYWEIVVRLGIAAVIGFVIGLERSLSGHPAGERTHALACLGSAIFGLISLTSYTNGDMTRIAAGVVSGLGFLGAGMILRKEGSEIKGLTSAAGIWTVGGIGLAIGAGAYALGGISAGFTIAILLLGSILHIDKWVEKREIRKAMEKKEKTRE